jgi:Fe-Mn family superoxide dismutase
MAFAAGTAVVAAGTAVFGTAAPAFAQDAFPAPALPYADTALEPVISAKTISFHYGKHTAAYYANLNKAVAGTPMASMKLEEVIKSAAGDPAKSGLFNNAAQAWNHTFYWAGMKPGGGGPPPAKVADALKAAFGSVETAIAQLTEAAKTQFGSGWAWLAKDKSGIKALKTGNAETPLTQGMTPLLTIDVWEHAYYLDYQNRRPDYVTAFLDKLVNWDAVAKLL